jgi:hypothetical protein
VSVTASNRMNTCASFRNSKMKHWSTGTAIKTS